MIPAMIDPAASISGAASSSSPVTGNRLGDAAGWTGVARLERDVSAAEEMARVGSGVGRALEAAAWGG